MQLNEYPAAIEATACQVADLDKSIAASRLELNKCEFEADLSIAFDADLKNDSQRKVRRAEILAKNDRFWEANSALGEATQQRAYAQAKLEALRHELTIVREANQPEEKPVLAEGQFYLTFAIDPDSEKEWSRVRLYDPVTHCRPELSEMLAGMIKGKGEYLIQLDLSVKALTFQADAT